MFSGTCVIEDLTGSECKTESFATIGSDMLLLSSNLSNYTLLFKH